MVLPDWTSRAGEAIARGDKEAVDQCKLTWHQQAETFWRDNIEEPPKVPKLERKKGKAWLMATDWAKQGVTNVI